MMINTSDWIEFRLSDLFTISGSKTTKIEELEEYGSGEYPYVTTKASNNGVEGFFDYYTEKGGCLTVDSAVLGFCSYQKYDFSASDHVEILRPKFKMNDNIAFFLTTIINMDCYRYSYGRKRSQKQLKNTTIKLPVDENEKPAWDYMSDYIETIKNHEDGNNNSIKNSLITNNVNNENNGKKERSLFRCSDLFDVQRGKLSNLNDISTGNVPVVSAYGQEQGVQYFLDVEAPFHDSLTISFNGSGTGYCSYHEGFFNANSDCGVLLPKFKSNKFIGLYLATVINRIASKYMYGRKLTIERLKEEQFLLPVMENGEIDLQYMEDFIKSLPFADRI